MKFLYIEQTLSRLPVQGEQRLSALRFCRELHQDYLRQETLRVAAAQQLHQAREALKQQRAERKQLALHRERLWHQHRLELQKREYHLLDEMWMQNKMRKVGNGHHGD